MSASMMRCPICYSDLHGPRCSCGVVVAHNGRRVTEARDGRGRIVYSARARWAMGDPVFVPRAQPGRTRS